MKTLLECQDEVARKYYGDDFKETQWRVGRHQIIEMLTEAAENYAIQSKWINVNDNMPDDGIEVLVWGENYFDLPIQAYMYMGHWKASLEVTDHMSNCDRIDPYITLGNKITHWQPLPLSPNACDNK